MEIVILVLLRAGEAEHKLKKKMLFARTKWNFRKKNTQDGTSVFFLLSSNVPSQN